MPPKQEVKVNTQELPSKEQQNFRSILRFYETKQYKKGLKAADNILKKYPTHGETLALKGLIVNNLKKKEEAFTLVKKGLAFNLKSHVCWHVYGLLYREDHKYDDAVKCFQNALKQDPENSTILKDLSLLQIQRRMYDGFQETRRRMLLQKTNNRFNWIAYAVGNHLAGNHSAALQILDSFANTLKDEQPKETMDSETGEKKPPRTSFEDSEMYLYRNMILEESGRLEEALDHLNSVEGQVLDKLSLLHKRAELLLKLNRSAEAEAVYRRLLALNPDCHAYHYGLIQSLGYATSLSTLSLEQQEKLIAVYEALSQQFPKSAACKRFPLDIATGEKFNTLVSAYLRNGLSKNIPSLFSDLRPLYNVAEKVSMIETLILSFVDELRTNNRFSASESKNSQSPSVLLWTLTFAAGHFDHIGHSVRALEFVDEAIKHTPTQPDLYLLKARIFKHAHDFTSACQLADFARSLDTQDRYLNTKACKYLLRADRRAKAEETISLFLKEEADARKTLQEMQVFWWISRSAESMLRTGEAAKAVHQLKNIQKSFDGIVEDQFDFHNYCMRKGTLRSYINMIRWADDVRGHRHYVKALSTIANVFLERHQESSADTVPSCLLSSTLHALKSPAEQFENEEEKKKQDKTKKKEQEKKQKEESKRALTIVLEGSTTPYKPEAEEDLQAFADPLAEAATCAQNLRTYAPAHLSTHKVSMEVALRRSKLLLCLKALTGMAKQLNFSEYGVFSDPEAHELVCQFLLLLSQPSTLANASPVVKAAVETELAALGLSSYLLKGKEGIKEFNDKFLSIHTQSLQHLLSAVRITLLLDGTSASSLQQIATFLLKHGGACQKAHVETSIQVHQFLQLLSATEAAAAWHQTCQTRHPMTPYFGAVSPTKLWEEDKYADDH